MPLHEIGYALAKFVAYCAWSYLGLYLLVQRNTVLGALKFGAVRWLLGLAFGVAAAIALGSVSPQSVAALYFGVYVPLRIIEWSILAALVVRSSPGTRSLAGNRVAWLWIVGGVAVSFATDLASPEGMEGRFCVGRCLC